MRTEYDKDAVNVLMNDCSLRVLPPLRKVYLRFKLALFRWLLRERMIYDLASALRGPDNSGDRPRDAKYVLTERLRAYLGIRSNGGSIHVRHHRQVSSGDFYACGYWLASCTSEAWHVYFHLRSAYTWLCRLYPHSIELRALRTLGPSFSTTDPLPRQNAARSVLVSEYTRPIVEEE